MADSDTLRLGKKPFVTDERDFKLKALMPVMPAAPPRFGHGRIFKDWEMLGNDKAGDCVEAGFCHQGMLSSKLGRHEIDFTERDALQSYSEIAGYDPANPDTDQGTFVRDGLNYWRNTGIPATSGTTRHKIGGYVAIPPQDWEMLMSCTYVFSSVGIGWNVPDTIWDQWDNNEPFDVVDKNAPIIGGHYTTVVGRSGRNTGGMITWGRRKSFTRDFYETYNDESWAIVFPDELRSGKNERGYDISQLNEMLASLG